MNRVVITGIGIVSCLGEGPDAHWQALGSGHPQADAATHPATRPPAIAMVLAVERAHEIVGILRIADRDRRRNRAETLVPDQPVLAPAILATSVAYSVFLSTPLGREPGGDLPDGGSYVGPTILDDVKPEMDVYKDEIFGPVLGITRVDTYEEAVRLVNENPYGNGVALFTRDGGVARQFQFDAQAGMESGISAVLGAAVRPVPSRRATPGCPDTACG